MSRPTQVLMAILTVAVLVGLPLAGHYGRKQRAGRCALDGVPIEAVYQVEIRDAASQAYRFCCVNCAERWLARWPESPAGILVTDETTGRELPASEAYFVRSSVVTNAQTGNRIHVFAAEANARRHADQARGRMLEGGERPFAESP